MSDSDSYVRKRAFAVADGDAIETAEQAVVEYDEEEVELAIQPESDSDSDSDSVEIEPVAKSSAAVAPFRDGLSKPDMDESGTQVDEIRLTGVKTAETIPDPIESRDETHRKQRVGKRIELIDTLNDRLEKQGSCRRYFVRRQGVSAEGPVFEDKIGKYAYETGTHRPSDIVKGVEEWLALDRSDKVVKTVAALVNMYPMLMDDVTADERAFDAVETMLVTEQDAVGDEDTFEIETVKTVAKAIQSVRTDGE